MTAKQVFNKENRVYNILIKVVWIGFIAFFLGVPLFVLGVQNNAFGLFGGMPSLKAVENPENDLSSELFSADGVSLGRYFRYNRSRIDFADLSPDLVNTLLLSEDHRFYEHSGLDLIAYLRVTKGLVRYLFTGELEGGGSTITQQLAKNLYTQNAKYEDTQGPIAKLDHRAKRLIEKVKEWLISVHLERNFTKEEIIAMYLNTSEFSSNAYGIKVAAETYFNKSPDSLNIQESAVLVGMLQAVTYYNPFLNYDNSISKRNEVLTKVYRHKYKIKTQEELDSIRSLPIELSYSVQNQNQGLATYFRSVILDDLMRWCKENGYDLWEAGLKIHTTIDSRMQRHAEEAVNEHMAELQDRFHEHWEGKDPWRDEDGKTIKNFLWKRFKRTDYYKMLREEHGADSAAIYKAAKTPKPMTVFSYEGEIDTTLSSLDSIRYYKHFLNTGFMSMDPRTGHIKAWVGGINYKYFKYDHVRQGKRQPGSTFKPFVYGAAIENGYPPCYEVRDYAISWKLPDGSTWSPPNADGTYGSGEKMTIRQGMARSINTITAYLMKEIGPQNVVDFAHRVGIDSPLDPVPSLSLGVNDVSVYEMVGAYSTFANRGIYTRPYYISKIEDKNGNVIANFVPETRQAISEETAYLMIHMLKGGIEEYGGTSRGLSMEVKLDNEIGGKTGTTNNASDGWYMGVTPNLVSGAWVGGDERSIHFRSWVMGQGGTTARPIWDKYMQKIYADEDLQYNKTTFPQPVGGLNVELDCGQYRTPDTALDSIQAPVEDAWDLDDIQ
ncbi:MAG: penicillin-binding protein 1A [Candidatus Cyclobacteriaceae bacterium M2_1C_046]